MMSGMARWQRYERDGVDETISPHDNMFDPRRRGHYFSVGRSAAEIVALTLMKAKIDRVSTVLDLACGSGRVLRHLVRLMPEASFTAADIDAEHVAFCASQFGANPLISAEAIETMPLDGSFDLIWCGSLLTHLPAARFEAALSAIARWLAPRGVAIVTLHGRWAMRRQAETPYKYFDDKTFGPIVEGVARLGFGYVDYTQDKKIGGQERYGVSVSLPSWITGRLEAMPDVRLLDYWERAWDNHQDALVMWKHPIAAHPWIFEDQVSD
jgi:SAM-dependent methyltransferase